MPAEATKVLFEIDSHHEDKELCLTILGRTCRKNEAVTKILHDGAQNFGEGWGEAPVAFSGGNRTQRAYRHH